MGNVYVAGVGMTEFIKPRGLRGYEEMGLEACVKALIDAGVSYDEVETVYAAYCYGDSTSGQRVVYQLGMTGIPVINVNNNCSTGSTARSIKAASLLNQDWRIAYSAWGLKKMARGSLSSKWDDRTNPLDRFVHVMSETHGVQPAPFACQLFANAGEEYITQHGGSMDSMAKIAQINHGHSVNNPYSQFKDAYTLDQVKQAPCVYKVGGYSATKLQACPTSDGAAATVLVSEKFVQSHPECQANLVQIAGQAMTTDFTSTFSKSAVDLVGFDMARKAARLALKQAKISAKDVQVIELHDCFAANELVTLDALELCASGKASEMVENGDITYGGKYVVNPSGGLISKGHPLGATGLAQCAELTWQLRGWATNRQVKDCKYALQHNLGLGGACVVTVYKQADVVKSGKDGRDRLGYNPAVEAQPITPEMLLQVQSKQTSAWMLQGTKLVASKL